MMTHQSHPGGLDSGLDRVPFAIGRSEQHEMALLLLAQWTRESEDVAVAVSCEILAGDVGGEARRFHPPALHRRAGPRSDSASLMRAAGISEFAVLPRRGSQSGTPVRSREGSYSPLIEAGLSFASSPHLVQLAEPHRSV